MFAHRHTDTHTHTHTHTEGAQATPQYLLLVQHVELISGGHAHTGVPARVVVGGSSEGEGVGAIGGGDSTPRIWGERDTHTDRERERRGGGGRELG